MQLLDDELAIAATDLGRFLSCRHLTALDIEVALGRRKKPPAIPDPFLDLLRKRGEDHEGRRRNAAIHELLEPVEAGRGLASLPEPSPGDVFLDLEGDHFAAEGGREYLFGMTVVDGAGNASMSC